MAVALIGAFPFAGRGQSSVADILEGADMSDPVARQGAVAGIRALQEQRRNAGIARVRELGMPQRVERPDGAVQEVADVDENGVPVYLTTHNVNAAISTGANVLNAAPYDLRGTNALTLAVWDGGSARATHQEFAGRVSVRDGSASIDHATHVAGTMIAAGVVAAAKGMAPVAPLASYDWNSDKTEMTAAGAATASEAINSTNKFLISNHSYGYISGWNYVAGGTPYRVWEWYGNGTNAASFEADFGVYNTYAQESDSLAFNAPYYLMFRSAGNERNNNPAAGQMVALSPGNTNVVAYDPALHPAGDGSYRGGFDTIGYDSVAKNVITVGSVLDAVTSGTRDLSKATPSAFSSFGPSDDGRIKPDVVANGEGLYSSLNSGDASYGTYSGTSMSTPNAAGTAALIAQDYVRLFGQAMRASTLKGLLIHTADDRGNAGPDYKYGWGLVNGKAAADFVRDHYANPLKARITENTMPTNGTTITREFVWDGVSPIRATLSWTDPAGTATTTSDLRSPKLRNNLDLKVIAPDGTQFFPYVMPFVGTWTQESMDLPATTGVNSTDNVEQVYVAAPTVAGVYRAVVSFQGTLANNQTYSLLISGAANQAPPAPALQLETVTPASAVSGGVVSLQLSGISLSGVTAVQLTKSGQTPINATGLTMFGEQLSCQVNLAGAAAGLWNVVATKGAETSQLTNAFTVIGVLYSENFDGAVSGWSSSTWALTNAASYSSPKSYFVAAPATKTTNALTSARIAIPSVATNLQLRFWHSYNLEAAKDGGRLLVSTNSGTNWFDTDATNSGVAFAAGGYNTTMSSKGNPGVFGGKQAWSGNSGGFVESVLNLNDTAKFAGRTVCFQWVLATDGRNNSPGWYVDSVSLVGGADLVNQPPSISTPASVPGAGALTDTNSGIVYSLVTAASAPVNVAATDDGGAANLTYTWAATGPAPVFFMPNGTGAASSSQANFEATGDYQVSVTVADAGGLSASGTVHVRVEPSASAVRVSPASVSLPVGASQQFAASLLDQFGGAITNQSPAFTWTATGGGTVSSSGLFTATQAGKDYAVFAGTTLPNGTVLSTMSGDAVAPTGEASDFAQVTVTPGAASVTLSGLSQTYDGSPKPVSVSTDPEGLSVSVTYGGSAQAPSAAGTYDVAATVTDQNYQGGTTGTLAIQLSAFDAWRLENFGASWESDSAASAVADADDDGVSNRTEYYLETDPQNPNSRLKAAVVAAGGGAVRLAVSPAVTAGTYTLKSWADLGQAPSSTVLTITERSPEAAFDLAAPPDKNFYQILYEPPPLP